MSSKRHTGRTTRMCRVAHEMAKRGKLVYILAASRNDQELIMTHCNRGDGIKVQLFKEDHFDWDHMRFKMEFMPRGVSVDKVCVLVDHVVMHDRYPALLEMYDSFMESSGHPRNSVDLIKRLGAEEEREFRNEWASPPEFTLTGSS